MTFAGLTQGRRQTALADTGIEKIAWDELARQSTFIAFRNRGAIFRRDMGLNKEIERFRSRPKPSWKRPEVDESPGIDEAP